MSDHLQVDEQTKSDLGLFNTSHTKSVLGIFLTTITQGGGARLRQFFERPLGHPDLINERSAVLRFFSEASFLFPVDSETVSTLAFYLDNTDVRSQLSSGMQHFGQRIKDMVSTDANHVFVNDGVQAALRFFYRIGAFIERHRQQISDSPYEPYFKRLVETAGDDSFDLARKWAEQKPGTKLSAFTLSDLDIVLRFDVREKLLHLLDLVYELDVFIAVGHVASARSFSFAKAVSSVANELQLHQVYHPHVENAVANDLVLDREQNLLFLTGANMAGKSTLMKSIGIALYLAHMGFPVPAQSMIFSVKDGLFSSVNLSDNLNAGASHYYAEVLRVKEVAMALKEEKNLFVIFDEMFRGTNVRDAYDATIAFCRAFSKKSESLFIISTHIMEAGEVLQQEPSSIRFQFLPTEMNGATPIYTRILKEGITSDRQGMVIIQNEGILAMLDAGIN